MDRRDTGRPGARLARSYLLIRAEQAAEHQAATAADLRETAAMPRLDSVHLNSPEAHAQYRLGVLARLATGGEAWFTLA